jgi:hypothetical protein
MSEPPTHRPPGLRIALVVACQSLGEEHQGRPLPDRLGLMMRHTGVVITITILTDALVFSAHCTAHRQLQWQRLPPGKYTGWTELNDEFRRLVQIRPPVYRVDGFAPIGGRICTNGGRNCANKWTELRQ